MAVIDITKGVEPFDDRLDTTRNNAARKTWGKGEGTDQFNLGAEYDVLPNPTPLENTSSVPQPVKPVVQTPEPQKFTHKLGNGAVLEAATVEELAQKIEKAFQQTPPAPLEFEDKPLYKPMEFKRKELTLQEQAELLNEWKENPQKALRKLQEAEFGAPIETIVQNLSRAEVRELNRLEEEAGALFVMEEETYNPTRANGKKLTDYLREKGKPITKQNLVLSFQQLVAAGDKSLLRPAGEQPSAEPAPATDENLTEVPPPPVIVPAGSGRVEAPAETQVDVRKFAAMPLDQQKKFFADLRRRT